MTLAREQAWLWAAITGKLPAELASELTSELTSEAGPEDSSAAAHADEVVARAAHSGVFVGDHRLDARGRLQIYADMAQARFAEAVAEDYPGLAALLGDHDLAEMVAAYVAAYPSRHASIGRLGANLPKFLSERAHLPRPDLPDLATLECARSEIFVAADPDPGPVGLEEARGRAPERWVRASLRFVPGLTVLSLGHDVLGLWRALDAGEPVPAPEPAEPPLAVAVFRRGFEVVHVALGPEAAGALDRARAGATIAEVCEVFAGGPDPAAAAFAVLGAWLADGWVAAIVDSRDVDGPDR